MQEPWPEVIMEPRLALTSTYSIFKKMISVPQETHPKIFEEAHSKKANLWANQAIHAVAPINALSVCVFCSPKRDLILNLSND